MHGVHKLTSNKLIALATIVSGSFELVQTYFGHAHLHYFKYPLTLSDKAKEAYIYATNL
jgi:hypothetical protein